MGYFTQILWTMLAVVGTAQSPHAHQIPRLRFRVSSTCIGTTSRGRGIAGRLTLMDVTAPTKVEYLGPLAAGTFARAKLAST